jgi:hypothetical protein
MKLPTAPILSDYGLRGFSEEFIARKGAASAAYRSIDVFTF